MIPPAAAAVIRAAHENARQAGHSSRTAARQALAELTRDGWTVEPAQRPSRPFAACYVRPTERTSIVPYEQPYIPQEVRPMARKPRPPAERFEQFVDRNGPLSLVRGVLGPCHIWTGSTRGTGQGQFGEKYGQFKDATGRNIPAHKFAYEQQFGPVQVIVREDGTEARAVLDHRCRRRNCVRPSHLELVDDRTNVLRGNSLQAQNARKTRCANNHDLTDPANVRIAYSPSHPNGTRKCRECARAYSRDYQARKRAASKAAAPITYAKAA